MTDLSNVPTFIWNTADLIRDKFTRGKYPDVILPFTVLRRIDCVLERTKEQVIEANSQYSKLLDNPSRKLRSISNFAVYNTSPFTFSRLLEDYPSLKQVNDDPAFAQAFLDWLFKRYLDRT